MSFFGVQPSYDSYISYILNDAAERIMASHADSVLSDTNWPIRQGFLLNNPLSQYWTWEAVRAENIMAFSWCYVLGMVGYVLALPVRIAFLAKETFLLLGYIFNISSCGRETSLKERLICLGGAFAECVSGAVGVSCPPLAYWMDEKIHNNPTIQAYPWIGGLNVENDPSQALMRVLDQLYEESIEQDVQTKAEMLKPLQSYFKSGVKQLFKYYDKEAVEGCYVKTLEQIAMLGFLYAFKDSLKCNPAARFMDEMKAYVDKYLPSENLGNAYLPHWNQLIQKTNQESLFNALILKAIKDVAEDMEKAEILERPEVREDEEFLKLYTEMRNMSQAIVHSDHKFLRTLPSLSGIRN